MAKRDGEPTLKLEGRLAGLWVHELRAFVPRTKLENSPFTVDIHDLTFADEEGEQALRWLYRLGGRFVGGNIFPDYLCKRLRIPFSLAEKVSPSKGAALRSQSHPSLSSQRKRTDKREELNGNSSKVPS